MFTVKFTFDHWHVSSSRPQDHTDLEPHDFPWSIHTMVWSQVLPTVLPQFFLPREPPRRFVDPSSPGFVKIKTARGFMDFAGSGVVHMTGGPRRDLAGLTGREVGSMMKSQLSLIITQIYTIIVSYYLIVICNCSYMLCYVIFARNCWSSSVLWMIQWHLDWYHTDIQETWDHKACNKFKSQLLWKDPPFLMGNNTISMAMFNSYVKLSEGKSHIYIYIIN